VIIPTYSQFRISFAIPASPLDPDGYPRWPVEKVREPGSGFGDTGSTITGIPKPALSTLPMLVSCNGYAEDTVPFVDEYRWFFESQTDSPPDTPFVALLPNPGAPPALNFGITSVLPNNTFRTLNGGTSWEPTSQNERIYSVSQPTFSRAWGCGDSGLIVASTNAGLTWTPQVTPTTEALWDIHFANELVGYAGGTAAGGNLTLLKTTDGGATWASIGPAGAMDIRSIGTLDNSDHLVIVGGTPGGFAEIKVSTDGGATFPFTIISVAPSLFTSVAIPPSVPNIPPNYGVWVTNNFGDINHSQSGGQAPYVTQSTGQSAGLLDIYALDTLNVWACGVGGVVLRTIDGANWTKIQAGLPDDLLVSIHFIDQNNGWTCGLSLATVTRVMYRTSDGGVTWTEVAVPGTSFGTFLWTTGPRKSMSLASFSGTVMLRVNALTIAGQYPAISPEQVISFFKNNHLYVQRMSDGAIQWVDVLRAMVANTP
jgi:photosystem II stability/assembly factor-like uncharacterized protein